MGCARVTPVGAAGGGVFVAPPADRLDRPVPDVYPDLITPIEETLSVLDDLVREGKIRYIGSSNFAGWQVADAEYVARINGLTRFVSATNEYNLLWREPEKEKELLPALAAYGVGFFPCPVHPSTRGVGNQRR